MAKPDSLISGALFGLAQYYRSVRRISRLKPTSTFFLVALSLVSQLSMLLAYLLPIKIVLMLGSDRIPRFFPDFLREMDKQSAILLLSSSALTMLLLSFLTTWCSNKLKPKVVNALLLQNRKTMIFGQQKIIAGRIYESLIDSLSGFLFFCLSMTIISFLYRGLFWCVICYIVLCAVVIFIIGSQSLKSSTYLTDQLPKLLDYLSILGFLVAFGYIVLDFTLPIDPPRYFFALIGLLFARQAMGLFRSIFGSVRSIHLKRNEVSALFFPDAPPSNKFVIERHGVDKFLAPGSRNQWVIQILRDLSLNVQQVYTIKLLSGFGSGCYALDCRTDCGEFLVKLYDIKKTSWFEQERCLMTTVELGKLALPFLGSADLNGYKVNVFSSSDVVIQHCNVKDSNEIKLSVSKIRLSDDFYQDYLSNHAVLWRRSSIARYHHLETLADEFGAKGWCAFVENFSDILFRVERLPHKLCLKKQSVVGLHPSEPLKLVHPVGWTVEPLGFRLDREASIDLCVSYLKTIDVQRKMVGNDDICKSILCANYLSWIEVDYDAGEFLKCFSHIERLINLVYQVKHIYREKN
ncbi:hypothetical protein [Simiduia aestuariiviva]|uniref:Uncharacterized protein n=1 Tax=Simiduia aestuariiviva TaxID=1510459 RepID=A0A839UJS6_9GAMM|nr:hypothetical protein [Simiduia aestuariiviva]MBB3168364.1 hypothetical protein [Simiduia aestuariiviva]